MNNDNIYNILDNFNRIAQEPAKVELKSKTKLAESMEQILNKQFMAEKSTSEQQTHTMVVEADLTGRKDPKVKAKKEKVVAEGSLEEVSLDLAKRARDKAEKIIDMDYDDMRDRPYGYTEKQRSKFQRYIDKKEPRGKGDRDWDPPKKGVDVEEGMFTKCPEIDPATGKQINSIINRLHNRAKQTKDEYLKGTADELFDILRNTGGTYSPPGSPGIRDVAEGSREMTGATIDKKPDQINKSKHQGVKREKDKNKEQARTAFGNMFGGGNPAAKLKIREQGMDMNKVKIDENAPAGFPVDLYKMIIKEFKDEPQKAYLAMWRIHGQMLEEAARQVKGKSYGGSNQPDDADNEDDDNKQKKTAPETKKGRGRPPKDDGAKSKYSTAELDKAIGTKGPKSKPKASKVHKMKEGKTSVVDRMISEAFDEKKKMSYTEYHAKDHKTVDESKCNECGMWESKCECDEGAGVMHFKDQKAKEAGKDSFKLGDKTFPVKEGEECSKCHEDPCACEVEEGNEFSGELAKAKAQHKDKFKVGGKEYPVKEGKDEEICDDCHKAPCECDEEKLKEDADLEQMLRIAGIKESMGECMASDGEASPMGSAAPEDNLSIQTSYNSRDDKTTITVTAEGEQAEALAQMMKLAGLAGGKKEPQQPEIQVVANQDEVMDKLQGAMAEDKDSRYEANTTPQERLFKTQDLVKGGDGDVAGREKNASSHDNSPIGDIRPISDKGQKIKTESVAMSLMKEYESIKVKK